MDIVVLALDVQRRYLDVGVISTCETTLEVKNVSFTGRSKMEGDAVELQFYDYYHQLEML
jgi:hypothetical protein